MANVFGLQPLNYQDEQKAIDRRRQFANALATQSLQAPQGQMVSGHYVTPGIGGAIGQVLGAYLSKQGLDRADQQSTDLTNRYNIDRANIFAEALKAKEGTPAEQLPQDVAGPTRPAVPGSNQAMAQVLLGSQFPDLQQVGAQQLFKDQAPIKASEGDVFLSPDAKKELFRIPKVREHVVGGQIFQDTGKGYSAVAGNPEAPKLEELSTGNGQWGKFAWNPKTGKFDTPMGEPYTDKPGTPKINISNSVSTEKKYGEQFAGKIAAADSDMRDSAMKAADLAQRSNNIKQLLSSGKIITGTGADFRLALGKAAGLVGLSDNETIANTEALSTDLARNTLDSIKSSGLGSGNGFSNADRDFLEKAVGGKINLEKSTLDRLATLAYKAAQGSASKWNNRVRQIPQSALEGTGITQEPVTLPELYSAPSAPNGSSQNIDDLLKKYGQ